MRNLARWFAITATLACLHFCSLYAAEESQAAASASDTTATVPTPQDRFQAKSEPLAIRSLPDPSAGGARRTPAPGTEEIGRLLGYVTLLAALAGAAIYLIKYGLPMHRNRGKEEKKLQVLEMRHLGNRQFLLVVGYEETRMLLGVTPGKIDYLCPLDTSTGDAREFSQFADQVEKMTPTA